MDTSLLMPSTVTVRVFCPAVLHTTSYVWSSLWSSTVASAPKSTCICRPSVPTYRIVADLSRQMRGGKDNNGLGRISTAKGVVKSEVANHLSMLCI